jgi:hypothetical protein
MLELRAIQMYVQKTAVSDSTDIVIDTAVEMYHYSICAIFFYNVNCSLWR